MFECDNFFERFGVPYDEDSADLAVHTAWINFYFDPFYVKWLITCWFDTVYAIYNGSGAEIEPARRAMAAFLAETPFRTYEELIANYNPEDFNANQSRIFWNTSDRTTSQL